MAKRAFDIFFSIILLVLLSPIILAVCIIMLVKRDFPFFYIAERMKTVDQPFMMVKFRTMSVPKSPEINAGVSGGDKTDRITPLGRTLRRFRLDELPQLWNVLKGDMSFVGPRPPLRQYTERHPEIYKDVLKSKPGVTGLSTLYFHRHEEWILSNTESLEETDALYSRRCVPRKARIDMIYQRNASILLDIKILIATVLKVLSARQRRKKNS